MTGKKFPKTLEFQKNKKCKKNTGKSKKEENVI